MISRLLGWYHISIWIKRFMKSRVPYLKEFMFYKKESKVLQVWSVCMNSTWQKQFKQCQVFAVFSNIMLVGTLKHTTLLHSVCDLKGTDVNVQCSLVWGFMVYKFKLSHNITEATKDISWAKSEREVDHRWLKKFCLGYKTLHAVTESGQPKTMDSKDVLKAIKENPMRSISQSNVVHLFHNLAKKIWSCQTESHICKILQNFWFIQVD